MLEVFIIFCIVLLWLGVNGYLTGLIRYFDYYTRTSQMANVPSYSIQNLVMKGGFIFVLLIILFPRLLKWMLSPFRGNKNEKDPLKIIQEYNFVNSIRDITQRAQEKTENWSESRKKLIIQSQKQNCLDCGLRMDGSYLTHKIPLHRGGTNDISNMKALCESCYFRSEIQNSYL